MMNLDKSFLGDYDVILDEAGRIAIPRSFREKLEDGKVVLSRANTSCIRLFAAEDWKVRMGQVMSNADPDTAQGSYMRRRNFGFARPEVLDKQGRVLIPPRLREFAGLTRDCIVLGLVDYIEIWDVKRYEENEIKQNEFYQKKEERELEDAGSSAYSGVAGGDNTVSRSKGQE